MAGWQGPSLLGSLYPRILLGTSALVAEGGWALELLGHLRGELQTVQPGVHSKW